MGYMALNPWWPYIVLLSHNTNLASKLFG
jgi:hypothetical protein